MATLKPKSISQSKLQRFLELEAALKEHKALREELLKLAIDGLQCQPGRYVLQIDERAGQRRPAWKEKALDLAVELGFDREQFEIDVVSKTEPGKPSYSLEVIDREAPIVQSVVKK